MSEVMWSVLSEFSLACIATLGFGLLFNVPRRTLAACCITGGLGRTTRLLSMIMGASPVAAAFIGALAVASAGYVFARIYKTPRAIFTVTGVIPMVPGVPAFTGMLSLASGDFDAGLVSSIEAILIGGALAIGLTTVRVITRMPARTHIL